MVDWIFLQTLSAPKRRSPQFSTRSGQISDRSPGRAFCKGATPKCPRMVRQTRPLALIDPVSSRWLKRPNNFCIELKFELPLSGGVWTFKCFQALTGPDSDEP